MSRRFVVVCVVLLCSSACTSWEVAKPTPAEYLLSHRADQVRVTRRDSSRIDLQAPVLRGDSLWGTVGGGLAAGDTLRSVAIALADVQTMEVRSFSLGKTVGLYLIIAVPLMVAACAGGQGVVC